ncbi:uncharacterized protein [Nicotiana sylvestris]|uniref:uncharacterized protein n=1 Tax=Nicotiana sylvestris TaxID=4096 RepID=UPI00388C6817
MTNPQDNPGTPPQPTPSDLSTPHPPSTTLQPRLRRVKMLARKRVASGALSKKLNEKLKASQAQDSDSDSDSESYKSANEGEGPGSSDSEKAQKSPSKETIEESGKKSGGSGSGEVAEGLVNLSSQGDEPGSSTKDTLADLLKKVGASYDPKKRRTPIPKALSAPKPSKKRKAFSPTTTETSLPKGRATRSRVKQSASDLQKALDESKKKGWIKERVHQEKVTTVEVQTLKPKKTKTSSKKSSSVFEAPESSLAKRTRFVVKSKQVRVSKDEEWSGDEESESDGEQDKLAMFGKRKILKGRLVKDFVEPRMMYGRLARNEIIEFMANTEVKDSRVTSKVKGVQVTFDAEKLGEILDIPAEGYDDYTRQR